MRIRTKAKRRLLRSFVHSLAGKKERNLKKGEKCERDPTSKRGKRGKEREKVKERVREREKRESIRVV